MNELSRAVALFPFERRERRILRGFVNGLRAVETAAGGFDVGVETPLLSFPRKRESMLQPPLLAAVDARVRGHDNLFL